MPDGAAASAQEARLARARSRSVYIATPIARHPVRQYTMALGRTLVLLAELGIRAWIQNTVGSSNLPRARNELAAGFLASDFTDLLFIDDDMGWEPRDVVRLLASDKPLLAGVGCKKVERPDTDPNKWCFRPVRNRAFRQDEMGAIEALGAGTGFMKIERRVFEALITAHPDWKRRGWPNMPEAARRWYYRFFRFGDDDDETGEDFLFCQDYAALGGEIWIDPSIRLLHVGEREYTGDLGAILEPVPRAEAAE